MKNARGLKEFKSALRESLRREAVNLIEGGLEMAASPLFNEAATELRDQGKPLTVDAVVKSEMKKALKVIGTINEPSGKPGHDRITKDEILPLIESEHPAALSLHQAWNLAMSEESEHRTENVMGMQDFKSALRESLHEEAVGFLEKGWERVTPQLFNDAVLSLREKGKPVTVDAVVKYEMREALALLNKINEPSGKEGHTQVTRDEVALAATRDPKAGAPLCTAWELAIEETSTRR